MIPIRHIYAFVILTSALLILVIYAAIRTIYLERKERKRIEQLDLSKIDFKGFMSDQDTAARRTDENRR